MPLMAVEAALDSRPEEPSEQQIGMTPKWTPQYPRIVSSSTLYLNPMIVPPGRPFHIHSSHGRHYLMYQRVSNIPHV